MRKIRYVIGLLLVSSLVAAACGGSDSSDDPGGDADASSTETEDEPEPEEEAGPEPEPEPEPEEAELEPERCVTDTPGPVKIGYLGIPLPGNDEGFIAGIDYVNNKLGGFCGGNTFEVVSCTSRFTPESTVDCLNQFIAENVVVATGLTLLFVNPDDLTSARLASFGAAPGSVPEGDSVESSTHFLPPASAFLGAPLAAMEALGFSDGALFFTDNASGQASAERAAELAEASGSAITPTYFAVHPDSPDWTTLMLTATIAGPEFVGAQILPGVADCPGFIAAAQAIPDMPPFLAGSCVEYAQRNAADLAGNYVYSFTILPGDEASAPNNQVAEEVGIFVDAVEELGLDYISKFGSVVNVFATPINLARAIESLPITEITGETIYDYLPKAAFDVFMSGPIDCGNRPDPGQTGCGNNMWLYEIAADGTFINRGKLPVLQ